MTMTEMGSSSLVQGNKLGIMGDGDDDHVVGYHQDDADSLSSDVSSLASSDGESDEENSSSDSSPSLSDDHLTGEHALTDMSDLLQQLPFKRGLSKHFQGKSQSFTSLSNVRCLEDLAKPENPYNKKLKSCRSHVGLSRVLPPPTRSASSSKLFSGTPSSSSSRAACSSLGVGRLSSRPPAHPPHRSTAAATASGFSNQTPMFV